MVRHARKLIGVLATLSVVVLLSAGVAAGASADDRKVPVITADVPSTIPIGGTALITGQMTIDGQPTPDWQINWLATCDDGYEIPVYYGSLTTASDGTFSFTFDPGRCAGMHLQFADVGTPEVWSMIAGPYDVTVPWHRYAVSVAGPSTATAGQPYDVTLTATRDGLPASGVPLTVAVTEPAGEVEDLDGTTGDDGSLTVHVTTDAWTTYRLRAVTPDTSDTLRGGRSLDTFAEAVPQSVTTSPTSAAVARHVVTINGDVARDDGNVGGVQITLLARDDATGARRHHVAYTASDGSFVFQDVPAAGGHTTYRIVPSTGTRYSATQARTTVVVRKVHPHLSITTDRNSYRVGQRARVNVTLTAGTDRRAIRLVAREPDGTRHLIYQGSVPAHGLLLRRTVRHDELLLAHASGDAAHAPASARAEIVARR